VYWCWCWRVRDPEGDIVCGGDDCDRCVHVYVTRHDKQQSRIKCHA
jgi:hypothetical protein